MSNFITNSNAKDLKERLSEIIGVSKELKFWWVLLLFRH